MTFINSYINPKLWLDSKEDGVTFDIRGSIGDKPDVERWQWFVGIDDDNIRSCAYAILGSKNCVFKWNMGLGIWKLRPAGRLYVQPYVHSRSFETRVWNHNECKLEEIDWTHYLNWLASWNAYRARVLDADREQERAIMFMTGTKRRVVPDDIPGTFPVGIFSVSNDENAREFSLFVASHGIAVVPSLRARRDLAAPDVITTGLTTRLFSPEGNDHVYQCEEFLERGINVYSVREIITHAMYSKDGKQISHYDEGCSGMHPLLDLWMVATKLNLHRKYIHDFQNNQTILVRRITPLIRLFTGHTRETLYTMRREYLVETYGDDFVPIVKRDISGRLKRNGRWVVLSIAGHLTNMILGGYFHILDWHRYFDTVEGSFINAQKPNSRVATEYKKSIAAGMVGERADYITRHIAWHTPFEYQLGADIGFWMLDKLALHTIPYKMKDIVTSRVNRLRKFDNVKVVRPRF